MATISEETKKQTSKMKGKPLKEKLAYFWEYYKIQTLIVAVALGITFSLVHSFVTAKDYALSVLLVNAIAPDYSSDYSEWTNDLNELIDFDQKKYEVYIDGSITIGVATNNANAEYANLQKLAAMMSSQSIDLMTANTSEIEHYAQLDYFYDLRKILSSEELEKYSDIIYYTDAATFSDFDDETNLNVVDDQAAYTVNHHDPDSMTDPIPVGLFITDNSRIAQKNLYTYLAGSTYQGYPEEGVIVVPVNTPRLDAALTGLKYLLNE